MADTDHPGRRRRRPSCWEIAKRRAAQARERRQRRRSRSGAPTPSAVVRGLVCSLEGMVLIALATTVVTATMEAVAELLRRPAQPTAPPPPRRPVPVRRTSSSVHEVDGFDDARHGETLLAFQARHRPEAVAQYQGSPRTQARYLHRALAGRARPSDQLAPDLAEAVAGLAPAARAELALVPPERLVQLLPAIAAGAHPAPPIGTPPEAAPTSEDDPGGGREEGPTTNC